MRHVHWLWLTILSFSIGALPTAVRAQDEAKKEDNPAAEKSEDKPAEEEVDIYKVPDTTDATELRAFLQRLMDVRPQSRQEALAHQKKAQTAAFLAADRIVSFTKDKASEPYRFAFPIVAMRNAQGLVTKSPEQKEKFLQEVKDFLADSKEVGIPEAQLMMSVTRSLEYSDSTELAVDAYKSFGEKLVTNSDERLKGLGEKFIGSVRRMQLVGNPLELTGTTLEGKKFNVDSLKGKTVLVDFWATWCGPCLATFPQMKELYAAYKDKGFEIVGVSVDEDRSALDEFMKGEETKLPWTVLNEEGGKSAAAEYYGVSGIPCMFLVGPDGKVVSIKARGDELVKLLEERFGKVEKKEDEKKKEE